MKVVSLFSGCGGLDTGFIKAGFDIIWANEFDQTIAGTYRLNHPDTILDTRDIRTLSGRDIPACDGIIGGPPCQSWSEGGVSLGFDDPRGRLFLDFIRIVGDKKPKFFVIENVRGILEERHKKSFNYILGSLAGLGYSVKYELLNAADYRIPQDRFRVFFVGIRNDITNIFNFPDSICSERITLSKAIGDLSVEPNLYNDGETVSENKYISNHDVYNGPYDDKYMSRNRVRSWDEVSFTIQAQARNIPIHPQAPKMIFLNKSRRLFVRDCINLYRRLSVRECARIQTFPDNFKFIYTDVKNGYKMVGNAVPPRLAFVIAEQVKKLFTGDIYIDRKTVSKKLVTDLIIPSKPCMNETLVINESSRVMVALVKADTTEYFFSNSEPLYYTGKYIPSVINLDDFQLFMPYVKGKGIKDLYYIKKIRKGYKKEVHEFSQDKDERVIFELKYLKSLFNDYVPIHLDIWHTYRDTDMGRLIKICAKDENE